MDDLESFFWLLLYIFLLYRPDGTQHSEQAELTRVVLNWSAESPGEAHASKNAVMHFGRAYEAASCRIQETWGPACFALADSFRDWIADTTAEKKTYLNRARYRRAIDPVDPLERFYSCRDQHYSEVLAFFDEAIEALTKFDEAHWVLQGHARAICDITKTLLNIQQEIMGIHEHWMRQGMHELAHDLIPILDEAKALVPESSLLPSHFCQPPQPVPTPPVVL
ncbi:hypothetical protein NMY22_g15395 [Coprinellus aureogranulatus]|nr:hypothetical protein NMY22_g15395 [Coprinellus aureogranulatus]